MSDQRSRHGFTTIAFDTTNDLRLWPYFPFQDDLRSRHPLFFGVGRVISKTFRGVATLFIGALFVLGLAWGAFMLFVFVGGIVEAFEPVKSGDPIVNQLPITAEDQAKASARFAAFAGMNKDFSRLHDKSVEQPTIPNYAVFSFSRTDGAPPSVSPYGIRGTGYFFSNQNLQVIAVTPAFAIPDNATDIHSGDDELAVQSKLRSGSPVVFHGDVHVDVGALTGDDQLRSMIQTRNSELVLLKMDGPEIPRGPPESTDGKGSLQTIYVVGKVTNYSGPPLSGNSKYFAQIFDLSARSFTAGVFFRRWFDANLLVAEEETTAQRTEDEEPTNTSKSGGKPNAIVSEGEEESTPSTEEEPTPLIEEEPPVSPNESPE
jgi:hypothetical protein